MMPPTINCDREAERAVLGAMLRTNAIIGDVLRLITAQSFYVDAHQRVFNAIRSLYESGKPADTVTLANVLCASKELDDVGSYAYLADLWDAAPSAANAEHYARIVFEQSIRRDLARAGTEIASDAKAGACSAEDLIHDAETKVFS